MLPQIDGGCSAHARRFRDLVNAYVADMGGIDRCSEIKVGLAAALPPRRFRLRCSRRRWSMVSRSTWVRSVLHASQWTRSGWRQRLGLERRQRDVSPTLIRHSAWSAMTPIELTVTPHQDDHYLYRADWADGDVLLSHIPQPWLDLFGFLIARRLLEQGYDVNRLLVVRLQGADYLLLHAPLGAAAATPWSMSRPP